MSGILKLPSAEQMNDLITGVRNLGQIGYGDKTLEIGLHFDVGQASSVGVRLLKRNGELLTGEATGIEINTETETSDHLFNSFDYFLPYQKEEVEIDGNVFVKVPKFYLKKERTTTYERDWISATRHSGYYLPQAFIDPNTGEELDYYLVGKYRAWVDSSGANPILRSVPNKVPTTRLTRAVYRTYARNNDTGDTTSKYHINDMRVYQDLMVTPAMIMLGTRHFQSVLTGFTSGRYSSSDTIIEIGTATNVIKVSPATATNYRVNQTIEIGTSLGGGQIAQARKILDIDATVIDEVAFTISGDPVTVAVGNIIYNMAYETGLTRNIKGLIGYYRDNDGKNPMTLLGFEDLFGGVYEHIDGIKISNHRAYIASNPKDYNDTASVGGVYNLPYRPLLYTNALANGYVSGLGYDNTYPFAELPTAAVGSSTTRFADYYYQNPGDRTVFVGGHWYFGAYAGPFFWSLGNSLGGSYILVGSRLCKRP